MRHGKRRTKLGMKTAQRNATMRNMVKGLFKHQRIETTVRRAKEARRLAERLITLSKDDSIAARRRAYSILTDRDLVTKLFKEIGSKYTDRPGGWDVLKETREFEGYVSDYEYARVGGPNKQLSVCLVTPAGREKFKSRIIVVREL